MASVELSIEAIHEYFLKNGGIVANHDVVKHFRPYLTNSSTKEDARVKFKKYINILATTKTDGDDKFLVLRPQYASRIESPYNDPRNLVGIPLSPMSSIQDFVQISPSHRQPPPYRPPPPPPPPSTPSSLILSPGNSFDLSNFSIDTSFSQETAVTPQAPPRRRSTDKTKHDLKSAEVEDTKNVKDVDKSTGSDEEIAVQENEKQSVSVKERLQKFNRLASVEDELSPKPFKDKKKQQGKGADEDDGVSVTSLDQKKCVEWLVMAAKGAYQELAKLASDEPRLAKLKDPFSTVLHWGAKHGNADIVKLFAGKYHVDVNAKTGYTPLHTAVQFGHKHIYNLLIEVYKADPNVRDFSGRKPCQYVTLQTQSNHIETYKTKTRKKMSDKDLRFLRIGSLNVRVKKTTEAFSNFLGVGGSSTVTSTDVLNEKIHKSWGSADNLDNSMPAPKGYLAKRKSKKNFEILGTSSTPGTPKQYNRILNNRNSLQDSDSDSAAGFDSNWQN